MSIAWMPKDMSDVEKQAFADAYPTDPHAAAAAAWESWAAQLDPEPSITHVSTGVQSVSYKTGGSQFDAAMDRAAWHRSRTRIKSVPLGPNFAYEFGETERDEVVYESPPQPYIGRAQVMTVHGLEGPDVSGVVHD